MITEPNSDALPLGYPPLGAYRVAHCLSKYWIATPPELAGSAALRAANLVWHASRSLQPSPGQQLLEDPSAARGFALLTLVSSGVNDRLPCRSSESL